MNALVRNVVMGLIAGAVGCALGACGGDDSEGGGTGGSAGSGGSHTGGSSGSGGSGTGGGTGTGGSGTGGSVVDDSGAGGSVVDDSGSGGSLADGGTGGTPVTDAALTDAALVDGGMCPGTAPSQGETCSERGACTYGGTVCRCSDTGADGGLDWTCYGLTPNDGGNPAECPAPKPADKSECAEAGHGTLCRYESGDCLCGNQGGMPTWHCF